MYQTTFKNVGQQDFNSTCHYINAVSAGDLFRRVHQFCFCLQNCSYQNKDHFIDETEDMVMNNEPCILTSNVVVLKMRGGSEGNKNN